MRKKSGKMLVIPVLSILMMVSGVYATWKFSEASPIEQSDDVGVVLNEFTFAPKETLHITDVSLISSSNASNIEVSFTHPTYISSTISSRETNGTVTYKVTLYNNTGVTYWYLGPSWDEGKESNALIGASNSIAITTKDNYADTSNSFNTEDWVPPYTTREIYITYRFGWNAIGENISTTISLNFGRKMDSVQDSFLKLLNDTISEYGYHYLEDAFNQQYAKTGSTVIANVGEEAAIFNNLFGGEPTINVNGEQVPVTIMIQRENVDGRNTGDQYGVSGGPAGCEYTLYVTVDAMDSPTGEAMVYAVSYSRGGEGDTDQWYQLGQLYEGTAPLITYDDEGNVAFDIESWRATANEYEFIDGYYYRVGYEQGDQYAKYKTIEELMSANDQNFYNSVDNSQLLRKVYAIVNNSSNQNKQGYEGLRTAFENAAPFYTVHNGGQEVKIKRQATRAELLPYVLAIDHAYDYYTQINH